MSAGQTEGSDHQATPGARRAEKTASILAEIEETLADYERSKAR